MSPKTILFASNNPHKIKEVRELLPPGYKLMGLSDLQWSEDIPEPFDTFEENAKAKASFVFQRTGMPCFADDSGLIVDALEGRPGVLSARYAGEHKSSSANMRKVLGELGERNDRAARFVALIAYQMNEKNVFLFTGIVEGTLAYEPKGERGFGYDPIFIPAGFDQTFGQLSSSVKNLISHRARAMNSFLSFLKG